MKEKIQQAYYFNEELEKIRFSCILDKSKMILITRNKLIVDIIDVVIGNKMYTAVFKEKEGDYHYSLVEIDPHKIYELFQCLQRKVAYNIKEDKIVMVEPKLNGNEKKIAYEMLYNVFEYGDGVE